VLRVGSEVLRVGPEVLRVGSEVLRVEGPDNTLLVRRPPPY
jgi:hypothetical protein